MRIGITGDTHGSAQAIRRILQQTPPIELWLHTGDYASARFYSLLFPDTHHIYCHHPINRSCREYYAETLLVNPGSPSRPRGSSEPCFAVLTLQAGQTPQVEFFKV